MTQPRPAARLQQARRCPEDRISVSARRDNARLVLDLDGYIPFFLFSVNNALSRGASRRYLVDFGVGIVEWRVASTLAVAPGSTARRICDLISLDKAAASRSLHVLGDRGLAESAPGPGDPRRCSWQLTEAGFALHDRIIDIALERERRLIDGIDPEDLEAFLRVMRLMRANTAALDPR